MKSGWYENRVIDTSQYIKWYQKYMEKEKLVIVCLSFYFTIKRNINH